MTNPPNKYLLITGASGFLGWNLARVALKTWPGWTIFGAYHSTPVTIPGVDTAKLDLTDFSEMKAAFAHIQPDAVIHTAALSNPNWVQVNRSEAQRVNVTATLNLAGLCADRSVPFVFTSTDLVFDGTRAPYDEGASVSPVSVYGEQKVEAEEKILGLYPESAICRMPLMFGRGGTRNGSFMQWMLGEMRAGKELRLFTDEFRTPASGETAAKGLLLAAEKAHGFLHLGGRERVSRYKFGQLLAEVFELPQARLVRGHQADVQMAAPRPPDVALDSKMAYELGYDPLSLEDELKKLKSES